MNEQKVRETLDFIYEEAHYILGIGYFEADETDKERALEKIRDKIETLTDDDLGGEEV